MLFEIKFLISNIINDIKVLISICYFSVSATIVVHQFRLYLLRRHDYIGSYSYNVDRDQLFPNMDSCRKLINIMIFGTVILPTVGKIQSLISIILLNSNCLLLSWNHFNETMLKEYLRSWPVRCCPIFFIHAYDYLKIGTDMTMLEHAIYKNWGDIVNLLLDHGVDINKKNTPKHAVEGFGVTYGLPRERSPLMWAVFLRRKEICELLIHKGADVNAIGNGTNTALRCCISQHRRTNQDIEIIKLLIDNGADINAKNIDCNPLMAAVEYGLTEIVTLLLDRGADINAENESGETALDIAALKGRKEICKLLLDSGADLPSGDDRFILIRTLSKYTYFKVLHKQVILGNTANVIDLIKSNNERVYDDRSPIYFAVATGQLNIVKIFLNMSAHSDENLSFLLRAAVATKRYNISSYLLNMGVDSSAINSKRQTSFHIAALSGNKYFLDMHNNIFRAIENNNYAVTNKLIKQGAQTNMLNKKDETPLMVASRQGSHDFIDLLANNKANVNFKNRYGSAPLLVASQNGHTATVNKLIIHEASIDVTNRNGWNAIMLASYNGHKETVDILVRHNANINAVMDRGNTALIFACMRKHENIVEILIENGAEINIKNIYGHSALSAALKNGLKRTVEMLMSHGAEYDIDDLIKNYNRRDSTYEYLLEKKKEYEQQVNIVSMDIIPTSSDSLVPQKRKHEDIIEAPHLELLASTCARVSEKETNNYDINILTRKRKSENVAFPETNKFNKV